MPATIALPEFCALSRRRLRRWRAHAGERECLRGLVVALNHLAGVPPHLAGDTAREPPTREQQRHLSRLGQAARRYARLGRVPGCELGRFWPRASQLDDELRAVEADPRTFATELFEYQCRPNSMHAASPGPSPASQESDFFDDGAGVDDRDDD